MARSTESRRERRIAAGAGVRQMRFGGVINRYPPIAIMSADEIEAIHLASLRLLAETGIEVLHDESRALLRAAGAEVDDSTLRVRFDPPMIEETIRTAPSSFTLQARNPARNLIVGDGSLIFAATGGPAFVHDMDRGRRAGNYADMCDYIRLVHSLNVIHQEGGCPCEPTDLPPDSRHLDFYHAAIRLTDKNWQCWALGGYRVEDAIEMLSITLGQTRDELRQNPATLTVINSNSPLRLDIPMGEGLIAMSRAGQPIALTPFTLSGAMSPVTIAGALTQQNAEALALIALAQVVAPGAPVLYGGFTSNVDMRTGSPAFGTPEYAKAQIASGQLARRYNVPFRSSNVTASNAVDVQAAYESGMSLWSTIMGGVHLIEHAAGWLEGGLTASFEKLVLDAEMLQMMRSFLTPVVVDEASLAVDAISEVGPGGHFFGTGHTLARFENAFYEPMLTDWRNFENWQESGARTGTDRANGIWKELLRTYEQPPLDEAVDEALEAYVARRKEEIAAGKF
ncbi:trimethylamine methyltransferase family protein [Rhizobiaceae bacterium n13]|uniref:Methyltransferase n=1 Tax=Ferirhizobium litorale TaxID=2927786 RepID=A0AAE3QBA1_9HYPH|nr:trimethylamine methyltransferase family protein [Fererhizobium litorale]MDI7862120.1 trimethylamine methyltransferase family protein [Fererhizobium litorale]MDI7922607.1 trimethylamine methyltransferase family protein [Fererhizobium litorale]